VIALPVIAEGAANTFIDRFGLNIGTPAEPEQLLWLGVYLTLIVCGPAARVFRIADCAELMVTVGGDEDETTKVPLAPGITFVPS
jgi:hypothetical protein